MLIAQKSLETKTLRRTKATGPNQMLSRRLNKHKLDTQKQFSSRSLVDKYSISLPKRTREHLVYSKE